MPDNDMNNEIVQIHLASWRYLALLTLPPLGVAFTLSSSFAAALLLLLFFTTHYYCWRLSLDERLFSLLKDEESLVNFDKGMAFLWSKKSDAPRSLISRWQGASRLLFRAIGSLLALWLVALTTMLLPL